MSSIVRRCGGADVLRCEAAAPACGGGSHSFNVQCGPRHWENQSHECAYCTSTASAQEGDRNLSTACVADAGGSPGLTSPLSKAIVTRWAPEDAGRVRWRRPLGRPARRRRRASHRLRRRPGRYGLRGPTVRHGRRPPYAVRQTRSPARRPGTRPRRPIRDGSRPDRPGRCGHLVAVGRHEDLRRPHHSRAGPSLHPRRGTALPSCRRCSARWATPSSAAMARVLPAATPSLAM